VDKMVEYLADAMKTIRKETEVPRLLDEYYKKVYG